MRGFRNLLLVSTAALGLLFVAAPSAGAQVSIGINIGNPAPACPYGYFDYAPYNCSPYGYYGPEWFNRGVFYGAGPWFRGPRGFYGHVNHGYDPRFGYQGGFPEHGEYREPDDHFRNFHGDRWRDGRGHERGNGYGHGDGGGRGNGNAYGHDRGGDGNGHGDKGNGHGDNGNGHGDKGNGHGHD